MSLVQLTQETAKTTASNDIKIEKDRIGLEDQITKRVEDIKSRVDLPAEILNQIPKVLALKDQMRRFRAAVSLEAKVMELDEARITLGKLQDSSELASEIKIQLSNVSIIIDVEIYVKEVSRLESLRVQDERTKFMLRQLEEVDTSFFESISGVYKRYEAVLTEYRKQQKGQYDLSTECFPLR